jgi:hypothetical protein
MLGFGKLRKRSSRSLQSGACGKIELELVWRPDDVNTMGIQLKLWRGGRQPDSAARAYLTVIAKEPAVVRRALASG